MNKAVKELADILSSIFPSVHAPYHLHEPFLNHEEEQEVVACIREGYVSSIGKKIIEFENQLKKICQVDHAVAIVNGTAALQALLTSLEIGEGDEVLCPALTFVGTANAIALSGADPHFIDCCEDNLGVNPLMLSEYLASIIQDCGDYVINKHTGKRIAALLTVHIFGHPGHLSELKKNFRTISFAFH